MIAQRGFLSPTLIIALGVSLVVVGSLGYAKLQTSRLEAVKQEYEGFKAQVRANGESAEKAAKAKEAADKATKEKIDNETSHLRSANATLARQLRDSRAASRFVPEASATSKRPDAITYSRAKLERAIQQLDNGVSEIVARGDAARIDLTLALKWAAEIKP